MFYSEKSLNSRYIFLKVNVEKCINSFLNCYFVDCYNTITRDCVHYDDTPLVRPTRFPDEGQNIKPNITTIIIKPKPKSHRCVYENCEEYVLREHIAGKNHAR